jgi:hypothetical protein
MSVQIILKNSSIEDRHPTNTQLTNGEISLNYNAAGTFLSCKDTDGNIQQVGGVKIADETPGSPSKQALWFQPTTGKLFVYDGDGWLVVASGGSGPGSDTVDQILAGNGINSDPSTGLGTITLDADINFSKGLEFLSGQICVAAGQGLQFDVNGKLEATSRPFAYRGTIDLTSNAPKPSNPNQGDTWVNTADGNSDAVWNPPLATGTAVEAGDLMIYDGTAWTYYPSSLSPSERTDLGLGVIDATTVEVTSSTGSNVQLPAATTTTAGLLTAADKTFINSGASTWERDGTTLKPVDDTYDVEIGGGNIELLVDATSTINKGLELPTDTGKNEGLFLTDVNADPDGATWRIKSTSDPDPAYGLLKFESVSADHNSGTSQTYLGLRRSASGSGFQDLILGNSNGTVSFQLDTTYLRLGGTIPSAPNLQMQNNGNITTTGLYNGLELGPGGGDIGTNTACGKSALVNNTTGLQATAVGYEALRYQETGKYNTALGHKALKQLVSSANNTAVGSGAQELCVSGQKNTSIGRGSLKENVDGQLNVAIGYLSGNYIGGDRNTILGAYQGSAADSTLSDTVIISAGNTEKLRIDSTGSLLFGGTLPSAPNITLASGGDITANKFNEVEIKKVSSNYGIGLSNYTVPLTGINNIAFGTNNLKLLTSGGGNITIGNAAGSKLTEGDSNVAVGTLSLSESTTANNNVAIGVKALLSNVIGGANVIIGSQAGFYIEGSSNTILGAYKGTEADSTLNDTVIISAGTIEKLRIDSTGSLLFGGTLPAAPNITLNGSDGSAEFTGDITCTDNSKGLILKSPDGTSFRLSVANDGTLSAAAV